jgi:peptide/nickel transport system substrate-binding protein
MLDRRILTLAGVLLALVFGLGAASCGGDDDEETTATGEPERGGALRIASDSFEFTNGFDPTGEYLGDAFGVYSNLLLRTLVGYRHVAGERGNEVIPDLAVSLPKPTNGGRTYTFKLKDGIKFGPPLSREITSKDVEYAFRRIATKSLVAQYGFYYEGVIEGLESGPDPGAGGISGIKTPDDKTIVFNLTEPTGDFLYRVAMPAAAPVPEEVAKCFTKAGDYGRYVISSGPYMIEGSDNLDISSCGAMKPISGYNPTRRLSLVRNPDYDEGTDSKEARENFFDRWEWSINTNVRDYYNRIERGELDGEAGSTFPTDILRRYVTEADLKDRLKANAGDRTWYIYLNLTQPPFDDVNVRKAANLVMDKDGLLRAWGGKTSGEVATHIVPDAMFGDALADYNPYPSEGNAGDVAAAKAMMKKSKYDTNKDGVCDASQCKGLLHITRNTPPWTEMVPVIEQSLGKIGITLTSRELQDQYPIIQTMSRNVPIGSGAGWGKDYADASTFMVLFDSISILPTGNSNYALVGLKADQAAEGKVKGTTNVPSVDADIEKCNKMTGDARQTCWQNLDKQLMEDVVPWIPYLDTKNLDVIGPAVSKYEYDQFSGTMGYAHMAVDQSQQK